jgi:hypothetical protein
VTAAVIERPLAAGRGLEAVELPGDASERALVLLHEELGSVGLWRDFSAGTARGDRPADDRLLPLAVVDA